MRHLCLALFAIGVTFSFATISLAQGVGSPSPCPNKLLFQVFNLYAYECVNCGGSNGAGGCLITPSNQIQYFTSPLPELGCKTTDCTMCKGRDPEGMGIDGPLKAKANSRPALTRHGARITKHEFVKYETEIETAYYICFRYSYPWKNQLGESKFLSGGIAMLLDGKPSADLVSSDNIHLGSVKQGKDPGGDRSKDTYDLLFDETAGGEPFAIAWTEKRILISQQILDYDPLPIDPIGPIDTFIAQPMNVRECFCWPR